MPGDVAVHFEKSLDFLEPGDDAFLARGPPPFLLGDCEVVEFGAQIVKVDVTHSDPRP